MRVTRVRRARRGLPIVPILFVLITAMTLVEIALIFVLANLTGWLVTILIALVTAIVGALMIRVAGLSVMRRFQAELLAGRFPHEAMAEGALVLVGGVFLMTPGLITDLIGLSTLIPQIRRVYARVLVRWASRAFVFAPLATPPGAGFAGAPHPGKPETGEHSGPTVFDVPSDVEDADAKGQDSEPIDVEFRRTD